MSRGSAYTAEQEEFIRTYLPGHYVFDVLEEFNKRFPEKGLKLSGLRAYIHRNHLRSGMRDKGIFKYTAEQRQFFADFTAGHSFKEIAEEFNKRWPEAHITAQKVKSNVKRYNLKTGHDGKFKKGSIPPNKGKKVSAETYEKMSATMFKPGTRPPNWKPVGSTRVTKDGYVEIKVREGNHKWELRSRYVYKKAYGKIPKGYKVFHLDQDSTNDDLDNLILVSAAELNAINHMKLCGKDAEVNELVVNIAKLKCKVMDKEKKIDKH